MVRNAYDIVKDIVGTKYDFDGYGGNPGGLYQCFDVVNYVGQFFGVRFWGVGAKDIPYANNLAGIADVIPFNGDLRTGDIVIFGAVPTNAYGHVAIYGSGPADNALMIDQNNPAWSGVTEHTFNLYNYNPTHIIRLHGQDNYTPAGGGNSSSDGSVDGGISGKTSSRTYKFWEVTCEETQILSEKGGDVIEKTFQCSKYTGDEDGDYIRIDRWDGSSGYISKDCMKRKEDYDITVTSKSADQGGGSTSGGGSATYTGGDISYGGNVLQASVIRQMASACAKYDIWLSGFICQLYLETHWGNAVTYAKPDNNWGGLTWTGNPKRESGVVVSQGAPRAEGGYYMKFASMEDYFEDHCNLISDKIGGADAMYHANGKKDIDGFTRGLFRPVAKYDYAAVGLQAYIVQMNSIYAGLKDQLDGVESNTHITPGESAGPNQSVPDPNKPTEIPGIADTLKKSIAQAGKIFGKATKRADSKKTTGSLRPGGKAVATEKNKTVKINGKNFNIKDLKVEKKKFLGF